jgi:hypothetical protein
MVELGKDTRRHKPQHELKCWPEYFEPINRGIKPFDLRVHDRDYSVGDIVRFMEYDDRKGQLTGQDCYRRITYILQGIGPGAITPLHGLARGYSILGLEPCE